MELKRTGDIESLNSQRELLPWSERAVEAEFESTDRHTEVEKSARELKGKLRAIESLKSLSGYKSRQDCLRVSCGHKRFRA